LATVKPFRALRPTPETAKDVASPPYDVLSAAEARDIVKINPNSFLRVNKPELEFPDGADSYSETVYRKGKDNLESLIKNGRMVRDSEPSFYLYRLTMGAVVQTGLVALASVDEYDKGIIKKHEHTRPEKVNDRANHIELLNAQVGPVFLTYRFNQNVDVIFKSITQQPALTNFIADDDIRHEFWWIIDSEVISEIQRAFKDIPFLYIADGHHRSQSASEVCRRRRVANSDHNGEESYNYFLNVIFPDSE